jgi:hypothetical protein
VLDIQIIDDPAAATVALEPMRSRLLSELVMPASAATLATRVGLARQKVNYHRVVRYWIDVPGQDKRQHACERICPKSGPGLLSKSERPAFSLPPLLRRFCDQL